MKSPSKSCLLDPWPTFLFKECIDILLPSITRLVNCSLSEGVADEFMKAIVTPLIKKSVSELGFISKLVKRVVSSQLNDHVSLNRLENCFAHGWDLKRLRGHLTHEAALVAANVLVGN